MKYEIIMILLFLNISISNPFLEIVSFTFYILTDCVVVVYHGTIVAIGHGLLKKLWPF